LDLQEVASARVAEVVCGAESVSARVFALTPSLLGITPDPHCQAVLDIMPGPSRKSSWFAEKHNLQMLLTKFRNSKESDPRDKIYALLAISSDAHDTDLLRADYDKSPQEFVRDTVSFLLKKNQSDHSIYWPPRLGVWRILTEPPDWIFQTGRGRAARKSGRLQCQVEGCYRPDAGIMGGPEWE